MREKILIVDDEKEIADLVECYLQNEDFIIYKYYDSREAWECIVKEPPDLAVMDVMMPEIDGFTLCRQIRERYHFPVIMLTAKGDEIDKITGLTLGADDYIAKPFLPLEMVARVKAQLRRYKRYNQGAERDDSVILVSGLMLNVKTHKCTLNEEPLPLTPTEFDILRILCEKKGEVVSAESLFRQIWADEYYVKNNNTVTVHIRHLREKMKDSFEKPRYIKTVWGCGYKIEG
ncbi:VanR-ABDEGLN family DNA-binding response regulator [Eubacterium sp. am_0171]|uniref:Stage 0 sporulation protein A homolog n=1 Tax=Faecalicatena contorta TaxID=39482 RepID=A0A174L606_9FIRM|nr:MULTISPECIES: VanR-ABDEGLN family response regulator transcription factor [Clostridia]MSC85896.1 VanR-ABDEGLN family DNA-binding response regulator [Eubacterium sp. BIOML-A1]MSD08220.1 VanR-ABDEGLN family DNA-binding response regulator [Eubacterium sp. BIOML-A2]RYT12769.1 VanR-ABDEGLN family DNA-binding response regulator [Eubacterium sp. am_0171]CUP18136.1 Transcriptional regulatory protein walR [[Eubacterium] contortum] [Faecalicatena contorta]